MAYSRSDLNRKSNSDGKWLEAMIQQGCIYYEQRGLALIEKTPEPFVTTKIGTKGSFSGRFTGKAQPDFQGTLQGGRSVVFEAKMTTKDRIKQDVITDYQAARLQFHDGLGALTGVCCRIGRTISFVPWSVWQDMKAIYGRKYMTEKDIKEFQVPTPGFVDFLRNYHRGEQSK